MFCRMKLRIFDATPKGTPGLSTNFLRRTRNFRCPALHFLSFVGKLIFVRNTSHTGPRELTYVNLSINDRKWRAGHLKFLVRHRKRLSLTEVKNEDFTDKLGHLLIPTETGTENEFSWRFLLLFDNWPLVCFVIAPLVISEEAGPPETKNFKNVVEPKKY